MTPEQLEHKYNFHDSDAMTPFKEQGDSITVTFFLAKHLQYEEIKSQYKSFINDENYYLLVRISFKSCHNLQASEWRYAPAPKNAKQDEKNVSISQLDDEMLLSYTSFSSYGEILFGFEGKNGKMSEIRFSYKDAEVLEERFVNETEYNRIWENT